MLTLPDRLLDPQSPTSADETPLLEQALRALDRAEHGRDDAALIEAHASVARAYARMGELQSAEWYLKQGLRVARQRNLTVAVVALLCALAEINLLLGEHSGDDDARRAARERARDSGFEATLLAARADDPQWETDTLMQVADLLDRCGDHDDATALHCRALDVITRSHLSTVSMPLATTRASLHLT
jgi:hypothetical protein